MTISYDQTTPSDSAFLQRAVRLALNNVANGQAPFGALIVRNEQILGTGVNTAARDRDPTAHAEVAALRDACRNLETQDLTGATMVSSCEPCVLCHAACAVAGITRIIYAAPKELVPGIEGTPPLLTQMQAALRRLAEDSIQYVPTPGADEPFGRVERNEVRP